MLNEINKCSISTGLHSDHSIVNLELNRDKFNRGKEFWKFNRDLGYDIEYVKLIKTTVAECKLNLNQYTDKGLIWELTKLKLRSASIPYCIKKRKNQNAFKNNLLKEINLIHQQLDNNQTNNNLEHFNTVKHELEQIEKHEAEGYILRSKTNWTKDGEKTPNIF